MITYNFINIRRVFFILLLVLSYNSIYGQDKGGQQTTPVNEKYVNVDLFHGNLNVTIPLYTLKGRTLSCPVSLNYSPVDFGINGDKIEKKYHGGTTGLGWSLVAGGCITRKVNGVPDESIGTPKGNFLNNSQNFNPYTNTEYDMEEDEFSFNFAGHTGTFMYYRGAWKIFSDEDFKISPTITATSKLSGFIINTHDGMTYEFGGETIGPTLPNIWSPFNTSVGALKSDYNVPLAWYLKSMTSPERETINFDYSQAIVYYPPSTTIITSTQRNYYQDLTLFNGTIPEKSVISGDIVMPYPSSECISYQVILSGISSTSCPYIKFNYTPTTEPFNIDGYARNPLKIDNIEVGDFKKYVLTYDDKANESLKLTSVQEFATTGSTITGTMPAFSFLYAPANNTTTPETLTQLTYPTGGYTTFEYEYGYESLRLKSQRSHGVGSDKELTTLYYYTGTSGSNDVVSDLTSTTHGSGQNSIVDIEFSDDYPPHIHTDNQVYKNGLVATNKYKYTISDVNSPYIYEVVADGVFKDGLPNATVQEKETGYSSVWVVQSAKDASNVVKAMGYKHFSFVNFEEDDAEGNTIYYHNENDVGKMTQYEEFDSKGINLIRVKYEYGKINAGNAFTCYAVHSTNYWDNSGMKRIWYETYPYGLNNYKYKLVKEVEQRNSGFYKSTEYVYDSSNYLLRTKIISGNDPDMNSITNNLRDNCTYSNQTISYKYLMDFRNPFISGAGAYPSLEWFDMPIETIYKREGKITGVEFVALTLKALSTPGGVLKPQTIYTLDITHPIKETDYTPASHDLSTKDSKLKPRITLEYDNDGNLVGQAETNGRKIGYVGCSATSNKPLMVLKGMTYAEYVTSGALGNWDPENINLKRAACPNVQITSYTYDPTFGTVTSTTSPNGLSTYYVYDCFGRLRYVKDNNQNLLKTYEYTGNVQ